MIAFYRFTGMILAGLFFMAVLMVSSSVYAWQDDFSVEPVGSVAPIQSSAAAPLEFSSPVDTALYQATFGEAYRPDTSLGPVEMPPQSSIDAFHGVGYENNVVSPAAAQENFQAAQAAYQNTFGAPLVYDNVNQAEYLPAPQFDTNQMVGAEVPGRAAGENFQEMSWNSIPSPESLIDVAMPGPALDTNFNNMALTPVSTEPAPPAPEKPLPNVEIEVTDEAAAPAVLEEQNTKAEASAYKVVPAVNEMKGSDGKMYHVFEDKEGNIRIALQVLDIKDKNENILASVPTKIVNGQMVPATDSVYNTNGQAYWVRQDEKTGDIRILEQSIDFKNKKTGDVMATLTSTAPNKWPDMAVGRINDILYDVVKDEDGNPVSIKLQANQMVDPILFTNKKNNQPLAYVPAFSTENGGVTPATDEVKGLDGKDYHVYTDKEGNIRIASKALDFMNQRTGQLIASIPVTIENHEEKFPDEVKGANNRMYHVNKDNTGYPTSIEPVIGQQWDTITFTNKNGQPLLNIPTRLEKAK